MAQSNPNPHSGVPAWTLADRLRKAREVVGLSQAELADETGISRQSVGNYENGHTVPRRPQLLSWAMRCGVDLDWLQTGEEPDEGPDSPSGQGITGSGCIGDSSDAADQVFFLTAA